MNTVTVKNTVLGEGRPKIAVPLAAEDSDGLQSALQGLQGLPFDVAELRADFLKQAADAGYVMDCLRQVRAALPDKPLLFTFRRAEEGGRCPVAQDDYFALVQAAIRSGWADMVDIELFAGEAQVKESAALAKSHGVAALLCNHDFDATPPKEEIIARLQTMQDWGADICKIAVMPQSPADVLVLLDAAQTMFRHYAKQPLVAVAMGKMGVISRLAGGTFGSAMTFGAATKASAPGQIAVNDLRTVLDILADEAV
ncbi:MULTISPECIES: type I 3-dehydroquinate dehydratase [Neisseria]|uniref:3-dehydroquinate dehydratase n=1 Tax=Neisseria musculi TaxID=1815583 RepID=A0A7H1MCE6_9NEIS|nr:MULTISPECIES: type I 3-dehydroquinate dehydratase [Neisseria]MBF0804283.1 type I 3-dehydroquinate dehydratase [Neisseria sp. 19428wB4_WF04]QNT59311.1 3-dehydroquinate dehydratase, type I [Neisseria musculi]TFU42958.1 type I 3-dehydroquinate dehydratase [Neisseria sp. WF04]